MTNSSDHTVDYPLSARFRARLMGLSLAALGVVAFVVTIVVAVFRLPQDLLTAMVLLIVVAVVLIGWLLNRRLHVLRVDPSGYQVRFVRGAGVKAARWTAVEDVVTAEVAGARCVVLRLRDGGSTTIPVDILAMPAEDFIAELGAHLTGGQGYRPLSGR